MLQAVDSTERSAWADDFAVRLASRAEEAETLRSIPAPTIAEATNAGFFRLLVPRQRGGAGLGFGEFLDLTRRLGAGCASSAWTLSFLTLHAWLLCKFEPAFQEELFRDGAFPLAPAPLAPTGTATKVEGGYRVSGRWDWSTGVNHSTWVIVNCIEPDVLGPRFCVLPLGDVRIDDVWRVAGMAATGSNTVVIENAFVPEHRTVPAVLLKFAPSPGGRLYPGSTIEYPMAPTLALVAATPALGALEGAVQAFMDRMKAKLQAYSGVKQAELPTTQMRLGEAMAAAKAARLVWRDAIALLEREGPLGHRATVEMSAAVRLAVADVVRLANQGCNTLAAAAGASSGFLTSPLQRHLRDVQMMRGHVIFDWDRAAQIGGKIALGFEAAPSDLL